MDEEVSCSRPYCLSAGQALGRGLLSHERKRYHGMKFANLYWENTETKSGTKLVNIGNNLQFMAIDYVYKELSVDRGDIVYLRMDELHTYHGEYLILPIGWSLFDLNYMQDGRLSISPRIIPVFLSVTIETAAFQEDWFNEYNIAYLKRFEPIGCRDEYTLQVLRRYGIEAYLSGCLTLTFPRRTPTGKPEKVFVVDAPKELELFMPEEIKENCEVMTQQYSFDRETEISEIIRRIKEQYSKYAEEAALIITSRLHVAVPCLALGIPVILAKNKIDYRFSWLDKLLPLYDRKEYTQIDWNPQPVDCEEIKEKILVYVKERIRVVWEKSGHYRISEYFEDREKKEYARFQDTIFRNLDKAYEFMASRYKKEDVFYYSIWGMTEAAEEFYCYMKNKYPNARLRNVIDTFKKEEFHGIRTIRPEEFEKSPNEVIVVLAVKASNIAKNLFDSKGISEKDYVCTGDLFFEK